MSDECKKDDKNTPSNAAPLAPVHLTRDQLALVDLIGAKWDVYQQARKPCLPLDFSAHPTLRHSFQAIKQDWADTFGVVLRGALCPRTRLLPPFRSNTTAT